MTGETRPERSGSAAAPAANRRAALDTLVSVARRLDAATRIAPAADGTLLTALARTVVTVMDAQAASIAVHDPGSDRLVFLGAAGPAAGDVIGLAVDATAGIAGYAYATGQPIAVADAASDPRFDRTVADATGYLPGSILATPLADEQGTIGVLEVLDRRGGSFDLRDLDLAGAFAREATFVIRHGMMARDAEALLRGSLQAVVDQLEHGRPLDAIGVDLLVREAVASLPSDLDDPTWRLADRLARLRDVDPASVELVVDWLDVLIRHRVREARARPAERRR